MPKSATHALVAAVLVTGSVHVDAAPVTPPPGAFDEVEKQTMAGVEQNQKKYASEREVNARQHPEAARRAGTAYVGSQSEGIANANSVTAATIATAAIGTNVKGAKAGATVAPFLLAGVATPHQWKLTLATLDSGNTRAGTAYSYEQVWDPNTYATIKLPACKLTDKDLAKIRAQMESLRPAFEGACEYLVSFLPQQPGPDNAYAVARRACGYEPWVTGQPPILNLLAARIDAAVKAANASEDAQVRQEINRRALGVQAQLDALRAFKVPTVDSCYTDEDITRAYVQTKFNRKDWRVGVGANFDFLPWLWGFQPKTDTPLTRGSLVRMELRPEASLRYRRFETYAALGVGGERQGGGERFHLILCPNIGISWMVAAIGRDPLLDASGNVLVSNGSIAPHVTAGLSASVDWAPNPPADQATQVENVEMTMYGDFVFSKDLTIRIGVPVTAKLATRAKDQAGGAKAALQWTVPVSILAIIKK